MATYRVKFHIDDDTVREYVVEDVDNPSRAVEVATEHLDAIVEADVQRIGTYDEDEYDGVLYPSGEEGED